MITKGTAFDRRSFLKGAMLAGAGTAAFGLAGCAANGGGASGGACRARWTIARPETILPLKARLSSDDAH